MRMLIVGKGRVGSSIGAYASHLGHEVSFVTRREAEATPALVAQRIEAAGLVAVAIPDDRLADWHRRWRATIGERPAFHFSGARSIEALPAYHPLYSFPRQSLAPSVTARIAIAREEGAPLFAKMLPGATNPEIVLADGDRAFYHALAVLSGNFAAHLWNETAKAFSGRFDQPPADILGPYLEGVVERFRESPENSATGPVARRDAGTVAANLDALKGEPRLGALYEAFLASAWPDLSRPKSDK